MTMNTMQKNDTRLINQYNCFMHTGNWENGTILPQHERETPKGYTRRCNGFCSPDLYTYLIKTYGILFAKAPTRTKADDIYQLFTDDCGYGMDLNTMLNSSLELGTVLGCVALVMDADKKQPSSLEGMTLSRTFPFLEMVLPQNFTKLVVDRVGRIVTFGYQYYETTDETQSRLSYKVFSNGKVTTSHIETDSEGNETEVIDGMVDLPMGRIPVVIVVPSQEPLVTSKVPSSPTLGLYQQQLNIAVTNSLMDESLYAQQFSVLAFFTDEDLTNMVLGAQSGVKLRPGDRAEFLAPSGTPIDLMAKRVEQSVSMMIRTFANMLTNGTTQSGEAKVIDRQVGAMQLKNVSNYMELVEYKIYELFQAFMGLDVATTGYDYTVSYFKDFDLTDLAGYISQSVEVLGLNISDDAKTQIRAQILKKFLSGEDAEMVSELVEKELNNKEIEPVEGLDTLPPNPDNSADSMDD